ncbi:hypothetical protein EI555_013504, partial [Monodon monoceros]
TDRSSTQNTNEGRKDVPSATDFAPQLQEGQPAVGQAGPARPGQALPPRQSASSGAAGQRQDSRFRSGRSGRRAQVSAVSGSRPGRLALVDVRCTGAETGKAAGRGPDKRRQAPPAARSCRPALLLLLLPFFEPGLRLQHLVSRSTAALPTDRCSATAVKRRSVVLPYFPLPPAAALRFHIIFPEGFWKDLHIKRRRICVSPHNHVVKQWMKEQAAKKDAKGNICRKKKHHSRRNSKGAHQGRHQTHGHKTPY